MNLPRLFFAALMYLVLFLQAFNSTATSAKIHTFPADSGKTQSPVKAKNIFGKVTFQSTTVCYWSNFDYSSQGIDNKYINQESSVNFDNKLVPVTVSWLYSTQSGGEYKMNSFSLSLDFDKYKRMRRQQLLNAELKQRLSLSGDSLYTVVEQTEKVSLEIRSLQDEMDVYKRTGYIKFDSLFFQSDTTFGKLDAAQKREYVFMNKQTRALNLQKQYDDLLLKRDIINLNMNADAEKMEDVSYLKKRSQTNRSKFDWLLSVEKFNVGSISPRYADIILCNRQLFGVEFLINTGRVFVGGAYGEGWDAEPMNDPVIRRNMEKVNVKVARVGFGQLHKKHIDFIVLSGNKNGQAEKNLVIGNTASYLLAKKIALNIEYAFSNLKNEFETNENKRLEYKFRHPSSSFKGSMKAPFFANKITTNISYQRINPLFHSYGILFMRKDIEKKEGSVAGNIIRNKLTGTLKVSTLRDNLFANKVSTNKNRTLSTGLFYKPKNLPFVSATYSLTNLDLLQENLKVKSAVNTIAVTSGYTKRFTLLWNTTQASVSKQFVNGITKNDGATYSIMNALGYGKWECGVNYQLYKNTVHEDSLTKYSGSGINLNIGRKSQKLSLALGYDFFSDNSFALLEKLYFSPQITYSKFNFRFNFEYVIRSENINTLAAKNLFSGSLTINYRL